MCVLGIGCLVESRIVGVRGGLLEKYMKSFVEIWIHSCSPLEMSNTIVSNLTSRSCPAEAYGSTACSTAHSCIKVGLAHSNMTIYRSALSDYSHAA